MLNTCSSMWDFVPHLVQWQLDCSHWAFGWDIDTIFSKNSAGDLCEGRDGIESARESPARDETVGQEGAARD